MRSKVIRPILIANPCRTDDLLPFVSNAHINTNASLITSSTKHETLQPNQKNNLNKCLNFAGKRKCLKLTLAILQCFNDSLIHLRPFFFTKSIVNLDPTQCRCNYVAIKPPPCPPQKKRHNSPIIII